MLELYRLTPPPFYFRIDSLSLAFPKVVLCSWYHSFSPLAHNILCVCDPNSAKPHSCDWRVLWSFLFNCWCPWCQEYMVPCYTGRPKSESNEKNTSNVTDNLPYATWFIFFFFFFNVFIYTIFRITDMIFFMSYPVSAMLGFRVEDGVTDVALLISLIYTYY